MKHANTLLLLAFTTAIAAPSVASGCSSGPDFFVEGVLAPPANASPTSCVFTTDPTQPTLAKGILDVEVAWAFSDTYEAVFLVGNRTSSPIVLQGATVTVTNMAGNQLAYYTTLGAGFIDSASGGAPAYGYVQLTLVDPQSIDALRSSLQYGQRESLVTTAAVFGQTLGADMVTTDVFEFKITACKGCLITFASDPMQSPRPNCQAAASMTGAAPGSCFYGEDVPTDCHACYSDPYCRCGAAAARNPTCFTPSVAIAEGGLEGGFEGGMDGGAGPG